MNNRAALLLWVGFALGLLNAPMAQAADLKTETYKVSDQSEAFVEFPKDFLLISKSCVGQGNQLNCQAYLASKKVTFKGTKPSDFKHGTPAGSVLCKKAGGKNVKGFDASANERGFCA